MIKKVTALSLLFVFVFAFAISLTLTTAAQASGCCDLGGCAPGCTPKGGVMFHDRCISVLPGHPCYADCICS